MFVGGTAVKAVTKGAKAVSNTKQLSSIGKVVETTAKKTGGRLGTAATRRQIQEISTVLESRGYTIVGGGGKFPEEYLAPLSGKGTKGSSFLDISADHPDYGRLRINTVDVLKDGITPTKRELRNANRIRQQIGPNEVVLLSNNY